MKLWKEELFRQDIKLPGVSAGDGDHHHINVRDVVLEPPFLVVGGHNRLGKRVTSWIKVFQLAN